MSAVPVLLYHHVAPDREVTPEGFDAQLARLNEEGWRSLGAAELLEHLRGGRPAPPKSLLITFDDGYADNWVYAHPILKRRGHRALVFVVTDYMRSDGLVRRTAAEGGSLPDTQSDERGPSGWLSWEEVRRMSADGVFEIGSHTQTHKRFVEEAVFEDLPGELKRSRERIEAELGRPAPTMAWPWGYYEEPWVDHLAPAGYALAFTTKVGSNPAGADPLRVARFKVQNGDPDWLSRRLAVYGRPWLGAAYASLYGLDRKVKALWRR